MDAHCNSDHVILVLKLEGNQLDTQAKEDDGDPWGALVLTVAIRSWCWRRRRWNDSGRSVEMGIGLSPGADSLRTSMRARGVAARAWSTSAGAGHPLHWWPAMPGSRSQRSYLRQSQFEGIKSHTSAQTILKSFKQKIWIWGVKWSDDETEGWLLEPQLNKDSSTSHSTSLHKRPYQQCKAAEAPGNNLPSPWPFFWFHASRARAGFSKDGKSGSSECSTKAGRCLLKGLLQTALTCSSLRQMRCLWRDRAAQIKKKVQPAVL